MDCRCEALQQHCLYVGAGIVHGRGGREDGVGNGGGVWGLYI